MSRTVIGLFDNLAQAQNVVADLMNAGFERDAISLIARDETGEIAADRTGPDVMEDAALEGAVTGATTGSLLGGALGLLVGMGALVIPGIGPVIAAGSLATALSTTALGAGVGAAAGGLAGGLTNAGVHPTDVAYYTEGIRQGGVLVAVTADDSEVEEAQVILHTHGSKQVDREIAAASQAAENLDKTPIIAPGTVPLGDAANVAAVPTRDEDVMEDAKQAAQDRRG